MSTKPFRAPSMASFFDNLRASRLRAMFRRGELGLVALAVLIGIAAGLLVALIGALSTALHVLVFGVERLSSSDLSGQIVLVGPIMGGVLLGLIIFILSKTRKSRWSTPSRQMRCMVAACRSRTASLSACRTSFPTVLAHLSGLRRATRRLPAASHRRSASS